MWNILLVVWFPKWNWWFTDPKIWIYIQESCFLLPWGRNKGSNPPSSCAWAQCFYPNLTTTKNPFIENIFLKKFEQNKNSYANQNFSPRRNQQFIPDSWAAESWFHNFTSRENIAVFPGRILQGCQLSPNEIGSFNTFSHVFSCIC